MITLCYDLILQRVVIYPFKLNQALIRQPNFQTKLIRFLVSSCFENEKLSVTFVADSVCSSAGRAADS